MGQAEPIEILENAANEFGATATGIEIFDPEHEFSAAGLREGMAERRGIGVAQMEAPGRWLAEVADWYAEALD